MSHTPNRGNGTKSPHRGPRPWWTVRPTLSRLAVRLPACDPPWIALQWQHMSGATPLMFLAQRRASHPSSVQQVVQLLDFSIARTPDGMNRQADELIARLQG